MKKSTGHKPVLIGLGIYLVGFVLFVSISHLLEVRAMDAEIDGRLDRGARSISMILGQEKLDQLLLGETDEAEYARLVRELTDYTQMHGLTFLYVLQMKNGEVLNTVTSATAEEWSAGDYQANGEQYPEPNEFMILALNGGKVQRDELRDQWGHLRSMYIPFNGGDLSRYILCADLDIVEISAMQIRNLLSNILTGLVFLIFALPLFLLTSRNLSAQRNALAMEVEEQTARITELNADLQKRLEEVEEQAKITHQALQEAEQAKYDALRARQVGSALAAEKIDLAVIGIRSVLEVLAGKIAEAGQGSATQAGMIATTSHEVARINSSIGDVARNAQTASELSGNISVLAGNSAATASSAVESMHAVDRETQALRDNMNALGEHAQAIVQIISIISDVAEQTNLLALNAAIEAARAGEAGRGFAVVADEVRKLAERTSVSTTEVGKVIEAVRQGSQRSLEQTDVAIEVVAKARNLVQESGEAFAEIRRAVEQAAQEVRSIAVVSNQQSSVSASISQAMGEVDSISDQTSSLMLEADKALKELSRQAEALTRLVEELKRG